MHGRQAINTLSWLLSCIGLQKMGILVGTILIDTFEQWEYPAYCSSPRRAIDWLPWAHRRAFRREHSQCCLWDIGPVWSERMCEKCTVWTEPSHCWPSNRSLLSCVITPQIWTPWLIIWRFCITKTDFTTSKLGKFEFGACHTRCTFQL